MAETHQAFEKEIKMLSASSTLPVSEHNVKSSRHRTPAAALPAGSRDQIFKIGKISVDVVQGDITEERSDVIVVPTNSSLKLEGKGVDGAILRKGGIKIQEACDRLIENGIKPTEGTVVVTSVSGNLKSKDLFCVVFESRDDKTFRKLVLDCLEKAKKKSYKSISFPAIGTGIHGYSPQSAALGMYRAIETVSSEVSHLQSVRIVLFQQEIFQTFCDIFQNPAAVATPGFFDRAKNFIGNYFGTHQKGEHFSSDNIVPSSEDFLQGVVITIYGETQEAVDNAADEVDKLIDDTFIKDEIESDYVHNLSTHQVATLKRKAAELHIRVEIEQAPINTIKIKGKETSVHRMKCFATEIIGEVESAITRKREAEQLHKTIKWTRTDSNNEEEDYLCNQSFAIETAFRDQNGSGKYCYEDRSANEHFTIDFDANEEIDHKRKDVISNIVRVDLIKKLQESV